MDLTLVVLAAGKATRYGKLKQLVPVGPHGTALMDYAIYDGLRAGFRKVVVVVPPDVGGQVRDHFVEVFAGQVEPTLVPQELGAIPAGFTVPASRRKPWGTAHAVLAARAALDGPFAVVNGDDFYGATAYRDLCDRLASDPETAALVGYELARTLSPFGGVSRGICEVDDDGFLTGLVELTDVRQPDCRLRGVDPDGREHWLTGDEPTSMNLWGLTPAVLRTLEAQFTEFLERAGTDPGAEFLLSTAINSQVATGRVRLRVLPTRERWLGMTFIQDTPGVEAGIAELHAAGQYPERLSEGLT